MAKIYFLWLNIWVWGVRRMGRIGIFSLGWAELILLKPTAILIIRVYKYLPIEKTIISYYHTILISKINFI